MTRHAVGSEARLSFSEVVSKLEGRLSAGDRVFYAAIGVVVEGSGLFHNVIPNNGRYVIIHKWLDPDIFVRDRLINDFYALNKLDVRVVSRCGQFADQLALDDRASPHIKSLRRGIEEWKRTSDIGLHYLGPKFAYEFSVPRLSTSMNFGMRLPLSCLLTLLRYPAF